MVKVENERQIESLEVFLNQHLPQNLFVETRDADIAVVTEIFESPTNNRLLNFLLPSKKIGALDGEEITLFDNTQLEPIRGVASKYEQYTRHKSECREVTIKNKITLQS